MSSLRQLLKRVLPDRAVVALRKWRRAPDRPRSGRPSRSRRRAGREVDRLIALGVRLWSSDAASDARALELASMSVPNETDARAYGILELARWQLFHGNPERALEFVLATTAGTPEVQSELDLVAVDCFMALDRAQEALRVLARLTGKRSGDGTLTLRAAAARSLIESDRRHGSGPVVEALNTIYRSHNVAMAWRHCVTTPVGLTNLTAAAPVVPDETSSPTATVVTWVDGSGEVPALEGLCRQTWSNLQIVVLAEPQAASLSVQSRAERDPRVTVIECDPRETHPVLAGMEHTRCDFVTTQPPVAWVHPQRLEFQLAELLAEPALDGSVASHLIVGDELRPLPLGRAGGHPLVGPTGALAVFRSGDRPATEVVARFEAMKDRDSPVEGGLTPPPGVASVLPGVPLVLSAMPEVGAEHAG